MFGTRNEIHAHQFNGSSRLQTLVDPEWELIDPTPDPRALFREFDKRFFDGKLACVEVKWSPRMTMCAGICSYEGRGGLCSIRLSEPLLKLRPRKDLIQTLLHEMIHAYLFVTCNNRDREGHGPEFCMHMKRINSESGTNITIYHSFTDEVSFYQRHWWRCEGPCRGRPPYFGYVKRAMNRAPAPSDSWWMEHQRTCGGRYTKVKEPEATASKAEAKKRKTNVAIKTQGTKSGILSFVQSLSSHETTLIAKAGDGLSKCLSQSAESSQLTISTSGSSSKASLSTRSPGGDLRLYRFIPGVGHIPIAETRHVTNAAEKKPQKAAAATRATAGLGGWEGVTQATTFDKAKPPGCAVAPPLPTHTIAHPHCPVRATWEDQPTNRLQAIETTTILVTSSAANGSVVVPSTCIICGHDVGAALLNEHVNLCIEEKSRRYAPSKSKACTRLCPVCACDIDDLFINDHLDACLARMERDAESGTVSSRPVVGQAAAREMDNCVVIDSDDDVQKLWECENEDDMY